MRSSKCVDSAHVLFRQAWLWCPLPFVHPPQYLPCGVTARRNGTFARRFQQSSGTMPVSSNGTSVQYPKNPNCSWILLDGNHGSGNVSRPHAPSLTWPAARPCALQMLGTANFTSSPVPRLQQSFRRERTYKLSSFSCTQNPVEPSPIPLGVDGQNHRRNWHKNYGRGSFDRRS